MAPISSQDVPPAGRGPQLTGRGSQAPAPPPQRYAVFFGDGHANVYALDAQTGKLLWKTRVDSHFVVRITAGTKYYSDATTSPSPKTTDGIMAVDIDTGKLLWSYQATAGDVFMGGYAGAERSDACPTRMGPDMDIANLPILVTLPDGKRVLLGGTKSADVFALDPDNHGTLLDRVNAAGGPINITGRAARGSIVWGGATDGQHIYYGVGPAGLVALTPAAGKVTWIFAGPPLTAGAHGIGLGAAPTLIPGVVFEGAGDGRLFAVSSTNGQLLWQFNTRQEFKTLNNVMARDGAIASSGAVVVDGMVFVGSGCAITDGPPRATCCSPWGSIERRVL